MGFWARFKSAWHGFWNSGPTLTLQDKELAEWLGINPLSDSLSEVTYFTCLKMLSETIGKLPLKYYQTTKEGKIRADPDDMTRLLTIRPNPVMTPTALFTACELNCQHYGNGYIWIQKQFRRKRYGGDYRPVGLWVLPSKSVGIMIDNAGVFQEKGKMYYRYSDEYSGETYIFPQEDVIHVRTSYTFNGLIGKPVRQILGDMVDGAKESQKFMNNLYRQGLTASMALEYTDDLDEGRRRKLTQKYNDYLTGARNAGKIVPVPAGLKLTPLKMSLADSQFLELRKYSALQIAAAFGIKPNQLNNFDKSSYSSSEMQQLAFLVDTMTYRMKTYEEEINAKVLTQRQMLDGLWYKFNEKVILRTDSKTQEEILAGYVNNGIYTPNEARDLLQLPAKEGGDQLVMNGNYIPITMVGEQYSNSASGGGENSGGN
jgi:HK97 family phage portal protein